MLHVVLRMILTPFALIADILHLFVISTLLVLLCQDRGILITVPEGFRHNHFPSLKCLWKKPIFSDK